MIIKENIEKLPIDLSIQPGTGIGFFFPGDIIALAI